MAQKDPYDCKNHGDILQTSVNGLSVSYCSCLDLKVPDLVNGYYTGPQCAYMTIVNDVMPSVQIAPVLP